MSIPSIYTVISKSNPTGVYSRLPNSYIDNLVFSPTNRPPNPVKGEQYYDASDNTLYYWDGATWDGGGGGSSLPPGTYYGDYLYWNGSNYVVGSDNVNLGANSGEQAQGPYNVAIGYNAGFTGGFSSQNPYGSTATGSAIAIGYYAGYEQACSSIAIGNNAGYYQDFNNIAIGSSAGLYQKEINNIAIGIAAGAFDQGTGGSQYSFGGNSIAIGSSVGNNLQGYESVAIGFYAAENQQGRNSIAIGTNTANTSQGNYSVAIGRNTASSTQGVDSVAIGSFAGNTSQGIDCVSLGYYAGYNLQEDYSVAIGNSAGLDNQHQRGIAIGNNAGRIIQQYSAIAIGDNAGYNNQQDNCIAIGTLAGNVNQGVTGDPINGQAIAIGYRAAQNSQGDQSIAIGTRSGNDNQHDYGIAIGYYAGNSNQSTGGVAIGVNAGSYQQGEYSIALGYNAGSNNQPSGSIIINSSPTGLDASTGGLFINPIREGSSLQVLFYNPSSKEITYSAGGINAGADTQIIYNSQGSTTGSNNLTFTTNSTLNVPSANITSSANATGSSTGALIVSGGINVNGESTFNNLLYAPSLAGNFISRGNPGQSSALLLSNYNTVHYYSTTSATGFVDISTTMVENAVYEIEFNCYGANLSNNDMFLYPNYTFTGAGAPFYSVYSQSSGSPSITYTTNTQNAFYFDYVGGAIGWEPVGKIKIYNNRGAKKIKVEAGDTTAIVNGQGYWTAGAGFTPTSVSNIVYDTTTRWNNVGRLLFSSSGNVTFTNWNIWVKRIM